MRIKRVVIENFRSIEHLECEFDELTTLVGPNSAGKSTILRAIDWCLNADKGLLADSDRHANSGIDAAIRVRIDFGQLSDDDRSTLGTKYAPSGSETFSIWRTWLAGDEKMTGKALAFTPFERIRSAATATEKRSEYATLRTGQPELNLPTCGSAAAVDLAMAEWEKLHPERLTDAEVSDTHIFGFNGRGRLAEIFDFILVSADLRANEEAADGKDSILGRILQHALDRSALHSAVEDLTVAYQTEYAQLAETHLNSQLESLSVELTEDVSQFSRGRSLELVPSLPPIKPAFPRIELLVTQGTLRTVAGHQGHGFQRAMLVGALTVLSRHAHPSDSQMFLAIEEPELFQHPTQAKALAAVLRQLSVADNSVQMAYATHSPYFVDPRYFDQVRRVTSLQRSGSACAETAITRASLDDVVARLAGYVSAGVVQSRWDQVCLKYLPEALFAETVILVEGDEDAAVLQGLSERPPNDLAARGICVAPVSGKGNMIIPFTVLTLLGIQTLMVVDNDRGCRARMEANGRPEEKIVEAENKHRSDNRRLCSLVGCEGDDYPLGEVCRELMFIEDTLESALATDLPAWGEKRLELIKSGRGVDGKNAATYELAARECGDEVGEVFGKVLAFMAA